MTMKSGWAVIVVAMLPLAASAQGTAGDAAYCAKLTQLYRTYVNNPNDPRPVQPSPTAEYEQAIAACARGDTAAGIPPLEKALRNNQFTLPPREG
jgi:uncharacterized protein with NAD-binding domain and iron-sulfur cluster